MKAGYRIQGVIKKAKLIVARPEMPLKERCYLKRGISILTRESRSEGFGL